MKECVLITGGYGMLGGYLRKEFENCNVMTLGLNEENDFVCDLTVSNPDFNTQCFDTVIHTAGTEADENAIRLNLEGTQRLLVALEKEPPQKFIYISSFRVYSRDAGEDVTEDSNTWASDDTGISKILAEKEIRDWCEKRDVTLTIIRPARMFGNGVGGESLQLFNDAVNGKYIHIRGNNAQISLVTAYDVARAIRNIYEKGGLYNAADGKNPRFIEMVESMTANAGGKKRMTHLPIKWAEWLWRIGRWVPSIERHLSPKVVEERMKTLTINGKSLSEVSGVEYHDTLSVIEHTDSTYPYTHTRALK